MDVVDIKKSLLNRSHHWFHLNKLSVSNSVMFSVTLFSSPSPLEQYNVPVR